MIAPQVAACFVSHATILLAVNLAHDPDPVLARHLPATIPPAEDLLDERVLIDQVIRAPQGDKRLDGTLAWLEQVWFTMTDQASLHPLVLCELDRRRDTPVIFELDGDMARAADMLHHLARQCRGLCDVTGLTEVSDLARQWLVDRRQERLSHLAQQCRFLLEKGEEQDGERPSAELLRRILLLALEGTMPAADYLALHVGPQAGGRWDMAELTRLVRRRYPLLRRADVEAMAAALPPARHSAVA
ncbi:hypothetical protein [Niveispirillum fermenti]|uniref:hypothetical protein n=1 Tax=Niveispirillum fermenti TaxID=1233113 RepID=UPI003A84260C